MNKEKTCEQAATAYPLRIPTTVRDQLIAEARKSRRSLNSEIIVRLEQSLTPAPARAK